MVFSTGQIVAFIVGFLGVILTILNIIDKAITLKTKSDEPFNELVRMVEELDVRVTKLEGANNDIDKWKETQDETNEVLIRSVFALLEFEVHYCETEHKPISKNLERAKDDLHDYLAQK